MLIQSYLNGGKLRLPKFQDPGTEKYGEAQSHSLLTLIELSFKL